MTDWGPVYIAVSSGVFTTLGLFINYGIQTKLKESAARDIVAEGLKNALGIVQQAADGVLKDKGLLYPLEPLPGVPVALVPGVNYALEHFPDALATLKVTPQQFAQKLDAGLGRKKEPPHA